MSAIESPGGEARIEERAMIVSKAFTTLSVLFDECVRDVWTPLRALERDRLAQQFDDSLAQITRELDANSFGIYEFIHSSPLMNSDVHRSSSSIFMHLHSHNLQFL